MKGLLQKNLRRASIAIKAQGQAADLSQQLSRQVRENPSTKVAEEHALRAGQLSGARVCQALLQGEMKPDAFALCVAEMPRQLLHSWMENFGRCVSLLGETVVSLQRQIQARRGMRPFVIVALDRSPSYGALDRSPIVSSSRTDAVFPPSPRMRGDALKSRLLLTAILLLTRSPPPVLSQVQLRRGNKQLMAELLNLLKWHCSTLRASLAALRAGATAYLQEGERTVTGILLSVCAAAKRSGRARALWNRALLAAIVQVRRERNQLLGAVKALGNPSSKISLDSLQSVADIICDVTHRASRCGQVSLFARDPRPPLLETGRPSLHRLVARAASTAEVGASNATLLDCRAVAVPLESLAGDASTIAAVAGVAPMVSVCESASSDARYAQAADGLPGFPAPEKLLYLALTHGDQNGALRLSTIRRNFELDAHLQRMLLTLAPLFSLAMRNGFAHALNSRNRNAAKLFTGLLPQIVPAVKSPPSPLAKQRAENLAGWRSKIQTLLHSDRCTIFLYSEQACFRRPRPSVPPAHAPGASPCAANVSPSRLPCRASRGRRRVSSTSHPSRDPSRDPSG